ncbi:MAG TPA: o-succinylbenzoate synthase, partial [Chryseosolibacter sp.]
MSIAARCFKKIFHFNFKARTSRGLMKDKASWFIELRDPNLPAVAGWGECGPLPGLSPELNADFESVLNDVIAKVNASAYGMQDAPSILRMIPPGYSSVRFGFETALLDLQNGGRRILYHNSFLAGEPIPINGLIWMGDMDFLMDQINRKVEQGFRCLKLKVGGLDFERECGLLHYIRKKYFRENITIRLDANGGFRTD